MRAHKYVLSVYAYAQPLSVPPCFCVGAMRLLKIRATGKEGGKGNGSIASVRLKFGMQQLELPTLGKSALFSPRSVFYLPSTTSPVLHVVHHSLHTFFPSIIDAPTKFSNYISYLLPGK